MDIDDGYIPRNHLTSKGRRCGSIMRRVVLWHGRASSQ